MKKRGPLLTFLPLSSYKGTKTDFSLTHVGSRNFQRVFLLNILCYDHPTKDICADREVLPGQKVLLDDVAAGGEELPPRLDVLKDLAVDRLLHRGQHGLGHRRGQVAVEGAKPVN